MLTEALKDYESIKTDGRIAPTFIQRVGVHVAKVSPLESPGEWKLEIINKSNPHILYHTPSDKEHCIKSLETALQLGTRKLKELAS